MTKNLTLEFDLSNRRDIILYLIQKELLDISLHNRFIHAGLDLTLFSTDLGELILFLLGHSETSDALWEFYYKTMNHYAIELERHESTNIIMDCYIKLKSYK